MRRGLQWRVSGKDRFLDFPGMTHLSERKAATRLRLRRCASATEEDIGKFIRQHRPDLKRDKPKGQTVGKFVRYAARHDPRTTTPLYSHSSAPSHRRLNNTTSENVLVQQRKQDLLPAYQPYPEMDRAPSGTAFGTRESEGVIAALSTICCCGFFAVDS